MSISAAIRNRDIKVFAHIVKFGKESLRKIAKATGLSKDSVARSIETISKRDNYPESHFWETTAGKEWLRLLVIAMVYEFGIKGNQGAERMSEFMKRIRINEHVGVSPSSLRKMKVTIEEELARFEKEQEKGQKVSKEIVAAGDETWLGDKMLLVMLDLCSGYLIMEEEAEERSHEVWEEKSQTKLDGMGLKMRHFVSDRAKALIKLATSTFGVLAGADIFHAQYEISKWLGRSLYGKKGAVIKQLKEAEEKKSKVEKKGSCVSEVEKEIEQCKEKLAHIETGKASYDKAQQKVSVSVHAFSVEDNSPQSSPQVEKQLETQAQSFEQIAIAQSVTDNKDALGKFRRQIEELSSIVDAWWQWTIESLREYNPDEKLQQWLLCTLLPVIYWYHQLQKTQNPEIKVFYEKAYQEAKATYAQHPMTKGMSKQDLDRWRGWAEWASNNFHRSSSAVEGRNGLLSQSYRNSRGLTSRRLAALTTIHNYDTRRRDGSTPAERLYGKKFPDVLEWLVEHVGTLPLPRKGKRRAVLDPLAVVAV